ncbi:MAG: hypothetical protein PVH84_05940 [Candidatus Aminicenantes bacterium]|jgi:hypothetical protein
MNQDTKVTISTDAPQKAFALLKSAAQDPLITVRDDLYDFSLILDAIKLRRKKRPNSHLRLVDSGSLSLTEVEWLAEEGADVYTSDEVGKNLQDLERIQYACKKGHTILAYLHNGPLEREEESLIGLSELKNLGANGVYIYLSDKEQERDISALMGLADLCRRSGCLVYYHHNNLDPALIGLGREGAWIHLSDSKIDAADDGALLADVICEARHSGSAVCLHVERGSDPLLLEDLQKAGAFLIFKSALIDYRSSLKPLEFKARKQKLKPWTYYLYPIFF